MHDISKFLTPYLKKGDEYDVTDWTTHDKEFSEDDI